MTSSLGYITFSGLGGGIYAFSVLPDTGYAVDPTNGTVHPTGTGDTTWVDFTPLPGTPNTITFRELGLPSGALWSVTLHGFEQDSTGSAITFGNPNGSYNFTVDDVPSYATTIYSANPRTGFVMFSAMPGNVTIQFTSSGSAGPPLELSPPFWYGIFAGIATGLLAAFAYFRSRGGRRPARTLETYGSAIP